MSQPGPRQTKRQKKALAFRTRQKTGKKKKKSLGDEDATGFPIDENQNLVELADLPLEAAEVPAGGRSDGRKGKAEDGSQRQAQSAGSKKRRREDEEVPEERSQKRSRVQPADCEDCNVEEKVEAKKKVQPQRFILFTGAYPSLPPSKRVSSVTTIGNLKYTTTKDTILSHFSSCGEICL